MKENLKDQQQFFKISFQYSIEKLFYITDNNSAFVIKSVVIIAFMIMIMIALRMIIFRIKNKKNVNIKVNNN